MMANSRVETTTIRVHGASDGRIIDSQTLSYAPERGEVRPWTKLKHWAEVQHPGLFYSYDTVVMGVSDD